MAPHANMPPAQPLPARRTSRARSNSVSSASSCCSSTGSSGGVNQLDVIRQAYSRADSADSTSSESVFSEATFSSGVKTSPGVSAGGVRKRTRRPRLTRPKVKRDYKPRKDAIAKALREEAAMEEFPLADLEWSSWKRAIQSSHSPTSRWEQRLQGHTGVRHRAPFSYTARPAVYEVAVKAPGHHEKLPVLASVKQGMKGQSWEAALLSKDKLRHQVDRVLRRGCKLYVRRAPFSVRDMPAIYRRCGVDRKQGAARSTADAVHELRGLMTRVCDYAWRDHYDVSSRTYSHRRLVVNGVKVSD